jgi:hypothetical protein
MRRGEPFYKMRFLHRGRILTRNNHSRTQYVYRDDAQCTQQNRSSKAGFREVRLDTQSKTKNRKVKLLEAYLRSTAGDTKKYGEYDMNALSFALTVSCFHCLLGSDNTVPCVTWLLHWHNAPSNNSDRSRDSAVRGWVKYSDSVWVRGKLTNWWKDSKEGERVLKMQLPPNAWDQGAHQSAYP